MLFPAVCDAVGEKKREFRDAGPEEDFPPLLPPAPVDDGGNWSSVRVLPAKGEASLLPRWLGRLDLLSPMYVYLLLWAMAERRTERWRDQATMPRQARIIRAMRARAAPTQMKTVPSGRLDFCMKGASAVGGTLGAG